MPPSIIITVGVRNLNVGISALFEIICLLNRSDFRHSVCPLYKGQSEQIVWISDIVSEIRTKLFGFQTVSKIETIRWNLRRLGL